MGKRYQYEILGVPRSADDATLKGAFRKLAMKWHPDRRDCDRGAERKFKDTGDANEVLKDLQKHAAYDRFGHQAFDGNNGIGGTGAGSPKKPQSAPFAEFRLFSNSTYSRLHPGNKSCGKVPDPADTTSPRAFT